MKKSAGKILAGKHPVVAISIVHACCYYRCSVHENGVGCWLSDNHYFLCFYAVFALHVQAVMPGA